LILTGQIDSASDIIFDAKKEPQPVSSLGNPLRLNLNIRSLSKPRDFPINKKEVKKVKKVKFGLVHNLS
jgi:hypothetical protein